MIAAVALLAVLTSQGVPEGAPLDRAGFLYTRPLGTVPRGVVSLTLDAHALSLSRSLEDVRIVDEKSNQLPYLVVSLPTQQLVRLPVPRATRDGKESVYRFALPFDTLPYGTVLELKTETPVFEREVILRRPLDESRGRGGEFIDRLTWNSTPLLLANLPIRHGRAIEVVVDEGDNAPLPIASAQLRLPGFALRFVNPGTPLRLLYGNPSIEAPRYDLALITSQLAGQPSRTVVLSGAPSTEKPERGHETRLFGIAIAVAVVVLLVTLARLVSARSS